LDIVSYAMMSHWDNERKLLLRFYSDRRREAWGLFVVLCIHIVIVVLVYRAGSALRTKVRIKGK